jgi:hypothetical protein
MSARVKVALLAGLGLLLLQLGWVLSVPPHVGIDEFDHALRASSVVQGHWQPGEDPAPKNLGRGDLIPVRSDVAASVHAACAYRPYTGPYNCTAVKDLGHDEVLIASGAARYNPTFYAVVGAAAAPFHGTANLYALRAVTALLGCVLFMLVVWLAAGGARTRWPVAVLGLAALPTTVYSTSIATPNGLEMISGLGTWVALLAVVEAGSDLRRRRSAYLLLGLLVALLVNLHTMGAVWLVLIAATVAVLHGPVTVLKTLLPRSGPELVVAGAATVAGVFEVLWVLSSGVNDPGADTAATTASPWGPVLNGLVLWPLQAIGAFPMRNEQAPGAVYALELVALLVVAVLTLRAAGLRSRSSAALLLVAGTSFLVPAVLTVLTFHDIGDAWQGRYGMPFTAGLLVLAGRQLDAGQRYPARLRPLAYLTAGALVAAQVLSQWHVLSTLRPNHALVAGTHWHPPSLLLLLCLAGLAASCWAGVLRLAPDPVVEPPTRAAPVPSRQAVRV